MPYQLKHKVDSEQTPQDDRLWEGDCLNNLHIRHNNEEGKFAKDWLEKMSGEELESWYDKAYRSMLLLIEEHKHLETHRQINALKKQAK